MSKHLDAALAAVEALQMSDQLKRAIEIIGDDDPETIRQLTTCMDCGKKIEPQIVTDESGEAVVLGPWCDECLNKEHL